MPGFILEEDSDLYHFATVQPEYCGPEYYGPGYDPMMDIEVSRNSAPRDRRPNQAAGRRWPLNEPHCWFYNKEQRSGGGGGSPNLRS